MSTARSAFIIRVHFPRLSVRNNGGKVSHTVSITFEPVSLVEMFLGEAHM